MIQEARKNFEKYDTAHQIELIEGDARVVPIPARTLTVSLSMLQKISTEHFLNALHQCLKRTA